MPVGPPKPAPTCIACGDTGLNSNGGSCTPCVLNGRVVDWATCFHDFSTGQTCAVCGAVRNCYESSGYIRIKILQPVRAVVKSK